MTKLPIVNVDVIMNKNKNSVFIRYFNSLIIKFRQPLS